MKSTGVLTLSEHITAPNDALVVVVTKTNRGFDELPILSRSQFVCAVVLFACCWPCGSTCACKLCAVLCLVALSSSKLFLSAGDYLRVVRKTLIIATYLAI